jgi:hypothetical protein
MSSPALSTHPPPPPQKPADYTSTNLGLLATNATVSANVLGYLLMADDAYTAFISAGANVFAVTKLEANNLVLKNSGSPTIGWFWLIEPVASSDGVTPLAMKAGQYLYLNVSAKWVEGAAGNLPGSVVLHGQTSGDRTIPLTASIIGVNPNSPIGQKWTALGGSGFFGDPQGNEMSASNGIGTVQAFQKGTLWEVPDAGGSQVFYISAAIWAKYESLSGATDFSGTLLWTLLGAPTQDTQNTAEKGQTQHFSGGAVFVVRTNGSVFLTYGPIFECLARFEDVTDASVTPQFGYPTSDVVTGGGDWQATHLDAGDIYWRSDIGAHEMHGGIRAAWQANQIIGYPITDETGTADSIGRFNRFYEGVVFWTPDLGGHAVQGAILGRWAALGYEASYLGYPTSDEMDHTDPQLGTGRISNFQFGSIFWSAASGVITELPAEVGNTMVVSTPDGTALGGSVTLTLKSNGDYVFQCHMHDSGAVSYDFNVRVLWTTPAGLTVVAAHAGHVEGTDATTPTHAPNRDDDHTETGNNPMILQNWADIQQGKLWVTKDYGADGLIGVIQDLAQNILNIATTALGAAAGVVLGLGAEINNVFGASGIGATFGLFAGVVVFPFTGGFVLAVAAGVAVGAVTNALIQQRPIADSEYQFVNTVFQGTLPPEDQIVITNLSAPGDIPFTIPGADNKIYMNMGTGYANPINFYPNDSYPTLGQVFVHEMTHVWQIHQSKFLPGLVCKGIVTWADHQVGASVYQYGPPTTPWEQFGLEMQGAIVDQWFGGIPTVNAPNRDRMHAAALDDPYFGYIANNIRKGVD